MPHIATLTTDMQRDKTKEENLVFLEWDKIANLLNCSKRLIITFSLRRRKSYIRFCPWGHFTDAFQNFRGIDIFSVSFIQLIRLRSFELLDIFSPNIKNCGCSLVCDLDLGRGPSNKTLCHRDIAVTK